MERIHVQGGMPGGDPALHIIGWRLSVSINDMLCYVMLSAGELYTICRVQVYVSAFCDLVELFSV